MLWPVLVAVVSWQKLIRQTEGSVSASLLVCSQSWSANLGTGAQHMAVFVCTVVLVRGWKWATLSVLWFWCYTLSGWYRMIGEGLKVTETTTSDVCRLQWRSLPFESGLLCSDAARPGGQTDCPLINKRQVVPVSLLAALFDVPALFPYTWRGDKELSVHEYSCMQTFSCSICSSKRLH